MVLFSCFFLLHIEVFLPAQVPDSELDSWMES
ncbi:phage minor tail U family protein, partial [Escherichia coli P0302308.4]